jgi:hypothetical protein
MPDTPPTQLKDDMLALTGFDTDTIKVQFLDSTTFYDPDTHEDYTDLSAHVVGNTATLTGKTISNGRLDADDVLPGLIPGVGETGVAIVIWNDTTGKIIHHISAFENSTAISCPGDGTTAYPISWSDSITRILAL